MIDHAEYVLARVLLTISDDYEDVRQIVIQLNRAKEDSFVFMTEEIRTALKSLLERGWASAYDLWVSQVPVGQPDLNRIDELYYWITPAGEAELYKFPVKWFPTWNTD